MRNLSQKRKQLLNRTLEFIVLGFSIFVLTRPLFFSSGDFKVYQIGSTEIWNGNPLYSCCEIYDPSWLNFGQRYSNGPLWGVFIIIFKIFGNYSLFIFRITNIICLIILIKKFATEFQISFLHLFMMVALLFPARMTITLAQGSGIAFLLLFIAIKKIQNFEGKPFFSNYFTPAILMLLSFSFKPQICVLIIFYLMVKKKILNLCIFLLLVAIQEMFLLLYRSSATQLNWFNYIYNRAKYIENNPSMEVVGPYKFFVNTIGMNLEIINFTVALSLVTCILIASKKLVKNLNTLIDPIYFAYCMGFFLGPYSPAQDYLGLSILISSIFLKLQSDGTESLKFIPLIFFSLLTLSTDGTIFKSAFVSFIFALLLKRIGLSILQLLVFIFCSSCSIYFIANYGQSSSYYLAGIATWFGFFYLFNKLFNYHVNDLRIRTNSSNLN